MPVNSAVTLAQQIKNGMNPILSFAQTYEVHDQLQKLGCIGFREDMVPRRNTQTGAMMSNKIKRKQALIHMTYRVHHGGDYYTQAKWEPGMVVPYVTEIKNPSKTVA